jgi:nitrite reductase/ring-hydroxylating ferredoxin subunit
MATRIVRVGELRPGETRKFLLECEGHEVPGFVLNWEGEIKAYMNRCRHVPMEMDWVENQFLSDDGRWILCATHGALYEPATGECIAGPPCGKALVALPLHVEGDEIFCACPAVLPAD